MNTDAILGPRIRQADDPQLPCETDKAQRVERAERNGTRMEPTPFDQLHDHDAGPIFNTALNAAHAICNGCPVKDTCWTLNADEIWTQALIRGTGRLNPTLTEHCGTRYGYEWHRRHRESACEPCRKANSKATLEREARRKGKRAAA